MNVSGTVNGLSIFPGEYAWITVENVRSKERQQKATLYVQPHTWRFDLEPGSYRILITAGVGDYTFFPECFEVVVTNDGTIVLPNQEVLTGDLMFRASLNSR